MNNELILEKLKAIVKVYSEDREAIDKISETTSFINDLKINSANIVDVFLDIEDNFEIEFSNQDLESITNVADTIRLIKEKLDQKAES